MAMELLLLQQIELWGQLRVDNGLFVAQTTMRNENNGEIGQDAYMMPAKVRKNHLLSVVQCFVRRGWQPSSSIRCWSATEPSGCDHIYLECTWFEAPSVIFSCINMVKLDIFHLYKTIPAVQDGDGTHIEFRTKVSSIHGATGQTVQHLSLEMCPWMTFQQLSAPRFARHFLEGDRPSPVHCAHGTLHIIYIPCGPDNSKAVVFSLLCG